jgi:hypothetical protein
MPEDEELPDTTEVSSAHVLPGRGIDECKGSPKSDDTLLLLRDPLPGDFFPDDDFWGGGFGYPDATPH